MSEVVRSLFLINLSIVTYQNWGFVSTQSIISVNIAIKFYIVKNVYEDSLFKKNRLLKVNYKKKMHAASFILRNHNILVIHFSVQCL